MTGRGAARCGWTAVRCAAGWRWGLPRACCTRGPQLTGAPALPPAWALGHHHARWGFGSEQEVRRIVAGYQERGLPLDAVHLDIDHYDEHRVFTVDQDRFPKLPVLAEELRRDGVRLVSIVDPAVRAEPGGAVYESGSAVDAFVRDAQGRPVRGVGWAGESVFPDFTHARVRAWWGGLYEERLGRGFAGFWHDLNEPTSFSAFGEPTLPRSARHAWRGAAAITGRRTTCTRCAWLRPRTRGCASWCPASGPSCSPVRAGRGCSGTGVRGRGTWRRAGRGCGRRCRWCWGWACAECRIPARTWAVSTAVRRRAVSALVPAGRVSAAVPHARESAGGAPGALGVRGRGAGARARGAAGAPAAAAVLPDARASGPADRRPLCPAGVVGGAGGPGAARLRGTRFCWATACWWPRSWIPVPTGVRCSCRGAAGTTR